MRGATFKKKATSVKQAWRRHRDAEREKSILSGFTVQDTYRTASLNSGKWKRKEVSGKASVSK